MVDQADYQAFAAQQQRIMDMQSQAAAEARAEAERAERQSIKKKKAKARAKREISPKRTPPGSHTLARAEAWAAKSQGAEIAAVIAASAGGFGGIDDGDFGDEDGEGGRIDFGGFGGGGGGDDDDNAAAGGDGGGVSAPDEDGGPAGGTTVAGGEGSSIHISRRGSVTITPGRGGGEGGVPSVTVAPSTPVSGGGRGAGAGAEGGLGESRGDLELAKYIEELDRRLQSTYGTPPSRRLQRKQMAEGGPGRSALGRTPDANED